MKLIATTALLAAAAVGVELQAGTTVTAAEKKKFIQHLAQQGISFSDTNAYQMRQSIFADNDRWIEKANAEAGDDPDAAVFGHNMFSHMTSDEKNEMMGISKKIKKFIKKWMKWRKENFGNNSDSESESESSESEVSEESSDDDSTGPVSPTDPDEEGSEGEYDDEHGGIDWRVRGAIGNVKNQGSCGSCWAFAAVSQLESLYQIKTGDYQYLSEQQLVDCATKGNSGCNGGFMSYAFDYYSNSNAMISENSYKYVARDQSCKDAYYSDTGIKTKSYSSIKQNLSGSQWKQLLEQYPVSIAVAAGNNYFMNYQSGILDTTGCPRSIDHAVNMVGWGISDAGKEYWIVRNSWGTAWGENGYIRMAVKNSGTGVCMAQYLAVTVDLQ